MTLTQIRSVLYSIARVLGDVNAAAKGRIARRAARRTADKLTGRLLRRLFR